MDFSNYSKEQLYALYQEALDAYESGEQIMSDSEYDELVSYLEIENNAEIGSTTKSKSSAYTVKHSLIMGSLDKVHTKITENGGNWEELTNDINRHITKAEPNYIEFTPKFDGCSWSLEVQIGNNVTMDNVTVATRGDGFFGSDITKHFFANRQNRELFSGLLGALRHLSKEHSFYDKLIIRGEALVKKDVYEKKYASVFKNTRVFVSGNLNRDFDESNAEFVEMLNDIDFVCYDYRIINTKTSEYMEICWWHEPDMLRYFGTRTLGLIEDNPQMYTVVVKERLEASDVEDVYNKYAAVRNNYKYQLDGIVVKPDVSTRIQNTTRKRPEDMIAIKFAVEKMRSTIVDIEWNVGMTGECYPVAIVKPVYQDGKEITRASLHGYSYLLTNNVGIGSEITMVMNGDIIPGVCDVLSEGELKLPEFDAYVITKGDKQTPHLMKHFTEEEKQRHSFVSSAKALIIDGIAEKTAARIWDGIESYYAMETGTALFNLMQLMVPEAYDMIRECFGVSKSTENIINSLVNYRKNMTLSDLIRGLCINSCGMSSSEQCAKYISGINYDFSGLNSASYEWCSNKDSKEYQIFEYIKTLLNVPYLTKTESASGEKIPVIMTGDPSQCTDYPTKAKWLTAHPQYVETTKWSEVKILFTNDLESNTGKMKKAAEKNIEVRQYEP